MIEFYLLFRNHILESKWEQATCRSMKPSSVTKEDHAGVSSVMKAEERGHRLEDGEAMPNLPHEKQNNVCR